MLPLVNKRIVWQFVQIFIIKLNLISLYLKSIINMHWELVCLNIYSNEMVLANHICFSDISPELDDNFLGLLCFRHFHLQSACIPSDWKKGEARTLNSIALYCGHCIRPHTAFITISRIFPFKALIAKHRAFVTILHYISFLIEFRTCI